MRGQINFSQFSIMAVDVLVTQKGHPWYDDDGTQGFPFEMF